VVFLIGFVAFLFLFRDFRSVFSRRAGEMGVVDFSVLGALKKVRSFVAGPTPAEATAEADGRSPLATPGSRSGGPSPTDSPPPAAARSGGRRAIALRRQISSPQLLRCRAVRYCVLRLSFRRLGKSCTVLAFQVFILTCYGGKGKGVFFLQPEGKDEIKIVWCYLCYDLITVLPESLHLFYLG
jgi:1-phosphatidylinositol-3-phosphate 5-kinase